MVELGNISKLLAERDEQFKRSTDKILMKISDRLTSAFRIVLKTPDAQITWNELIPLDGSSTSVYVTGTIGLKIGDVISIDSKEIVIDESTVNQYNKFIRFGFPIIMLELATVEELVEHMERVSKIGGAIDVSAEQLAKIIDKLGKTFEEKILNDPAKLSVLDSATRPTSILGFDASGLNDEQIRKLKLFESHDVGMLN